jgi:hypothetical protein
LVCSYMCNAAHAWQGAALAAAAAAAAVQTSSSCAISLHIMLSSCCVAAPCLSGTPADTLRCCCCCCCRCCLQDVWWGKYSPNYDMDDRCVLGFRYTIEYLLNPVRSSPNKYTPHSNRENLKERATLKQPAVVVNRQARQIRPRP